MGVNITNPLPAEMQVRYWERKLRQEAVPEDPFTALRGVHSTDARVSIANEVYFELVGSFGNNNERFHRCIMQKTLSQAPNEGSLTNPVGTEEDLRQKIFDVFATDYSKAVSLQEYGIEAKNKEAWQIFEEITPKISLHTQEYEGKYVREALLERYSHLLTAAPHFLTQEWSPNIAVAGLASRNWPAFSTTLATYTNNIGAALVAAGVGAQACATIRFIQEAELYASTRKVIEPVNVGGKETYIVILPSDQAKFLRDPILAGSLGTAWLQYAALSTEELKYPGACLRIGRCLICEDPRNPTLTLGGSVGGYSLTPQYRLAGRDTWSDPRDLTLNARQVGYLLGKGAVAKWTQEDYHWEYEYQQYKKFGGKGIFGTFGHSMVQWDYGPTNAVPNAGPPTAATRQQDSSMVLIFSATPVLI
jgi:hypothetical protein